MIRQTLFISTFMTAALLVACGGGKKEEEAPKGGSLEAISKSIESPTGTVSSETAADVAAAYEQSIGVPTGGSRDGAAPVAAQSTSVACQAGGDVSVDADSSGESFSYSYNSCCTAADCCMDGDGEGFFDTSGSGTYSGCYSFDIDYTCQGISASYDFAYCMSSTGEITYSIEVEGDTFAVSGSITNGNGTLTIRGENGSWTCEYTDYAGTCTSDGGDSFTF